MSASIDNVIMISDGSDDEHSGDERFTIVAASDGSPTDVLLEVWSPPRVAPEYRRLHQGCAISLDLTTGWDSSDLGDRKKLLDFVNLIQPHRIILSPPCTMFSTLQNANRGKVPSAIFAARLDNALQMLTFAMLLARLVKNYGGGFVFEHPRSATSWSYPVVRLVMALPNVHIADFDQCRYGLRTPDGSALLRKSTRFLTNIPGVVREFHGTTCSCAAGTHGRIQGSQNGVQISSHAARYPAGLVQALVGAIT